MLTFISKTLRKLLASKGYSSKEVLERNLRGAIGTFGTQTGVQKNSKRGRTLADIGEVIEFLEPFTPWGVSILRHRNTGQLKTVINCMMPNRHRSPLLYIPALTNLSMRYLIFPLHLRHYLN
jgi:hypothetical protein